MATFKTKPSGKLGSFSVWLAIAGITLLGLILRVIHLDLQPLWWDEGYSLFFATRDLATMLERTSLDIHPPLYYALLQVWMVFAGKSEIAVRLLSVAIGTATIPLLYAMARRIFGTRAALLAACALALAPFHIYYSQEVRMYGLVTLLCLASVYLFVLVVDALASPVRAQTHATNLALVGYTLVTTAALYTQYFAAFILAFEILVVIFRRSSSVFRRFIAAWAAIAALYLAWAVYAGQRLYTYVVGKVAHEAYSPLDPLSYLAQHFAAFSVGHLSAWTWLAWASIAFVAIALFGIMMTRRQSYSPVNLSPHYLVISYLLVPLALGYLVNLVYPFAPEHGERLLLLAAPAFVMLVASGIDALWQRRAILGILAAALVALISAASLYDFYTVPRYPNDDYRPLIAQMQQMAQSGDAYLAIYPWQIGYLETYYAGAPLSIVETPSDTWINNPAQMQRELDAIRAEHPRIWLPAFQKFGRILEDALDASLRPRDYTVLDTWFGTTRLELFAAASDPPRAVNTIPMVANWGISTEPVAAGQDMVRLWLDAQVAPGTSKASVRLVDANGAVWAQDDRELERGMQRIGLAIPIGTPPANYQLLLTIYRASDNTPLQNAVPLARVNVIAPAQPNLAAIPRRVSADFANGIRLVGFDAGTIRPGEVTALVLYWQATRVPTDAAFTVSIRDSQGNTLASNADEIARGIHPLADWQPGELVRDPRTLTLGGDTPDGIYRIVVALANDGSRAADIGTVRVQGRPHYFGAPAPSEKFDARFGDIARLVGYDAVREGNNLQLVLYWQALGTSQTSYTVFVHALDASGNIVGQRDHIPGDGAYPTTSWVKGEYLVDEYNITVPPGADFQIEIGMYDAATNARLPVSDSAHPNATNQPLGDHSILPMRIK